MITSWMRITFECKQHRCCLFQNGIMNWGFLGNERGLSDGLLGEKVDCLDNTNRLSDNKPAHDAHQQLCRERLQV